MRPLFSKKDLTSRSPIHVFLRNNKPLLMIFYYFTYVLVLTFYVDRLLRLIKTLSFLTCHEMFNTRELLSN